MARHILRLESSASRLLTPLTRPSLHGNVWSRNLGELNVPGVMVAIPEVKSFMVRCMTAAGAKEAHGTALADTLLAADYRGHFSHGLNRLDMYVHDIKSGMTRSDLEPEVVKENAATAYVNGNNLLGPVVGNFSMRLAIKKAQEAGVGFVAANASNHYGIAGWYSLMACDSGLLGMSFTNTSPLVYPTRGREAMLGTNPITLAAPAKNGDSFVLDMATSSVAVGKIELQNVKKEPIPSGWGADSTGKETHDPKKVLDDGGLLPLGGSELSGGYKGYGLGMLVEVFCGILANGDYGPNIRKWRDNDRIANLGQAFIAINPEAFAPGFTDRMQDLMNIARNKIALAEGEKEILVAGDPERRHMKKCDDQGGILYHPNQIENMKELAQHLKIQPMKTKS